MACRSQSTPFLQWLAFLGWWIAWAPAPCAAHLPLHYAQPSCKASQDLVDCSGLRAQLALQWRSDSSQVVRLTEQVQICFLENGTLVARNLAQPQADTLMRMYQIGLVYDSANRGHWLMERAMMTLQRPQEYAKVTRRYLLEAIADSPDETPAYLFAHALEQVIAAYKANRVPLGETVATWAMLDRALLLRELGGGDEVAAIAALHKHYRLQMRTTLPDCQQLRANFEEGILLKTLPKGGCESFLVLYGLQQCDAPDLWAAAFGLRLAAGDAAWLQRMAGEEAYNRGLFEQSRTYWLRAVALEQDIHLQAADHLQIAQAWLAQQDYRKARASLHTAMQLHATWGEPYVRLMDVYLEGSKACGWNAFDHKALHWLLTDLCSQLLNVDPNYTLQANERLYAYRRAAPSIEEAAIHGFKAGDTYPLKCWMSTSTAVPLD